MTGVIFKTASGTILYREDLTAADLTKACGGFIEVIGARVLAWNNGRPVKCEVGVPIHAHTRYITEWWDVPA